MNLEDEYKWMVGAYFGIREMDSYDLKEYILKDIEDYIKKFISESPIPMYDYRGVAREIEDNVSLDVKLQDALIMLVRINAPMELSLMVRNKLKSLKEG